MSLIPVTNLDRLIEEAKGQPNMTIATLGLLAERDLQDLKVELQGEIDKLKAEIEHLKKLAIYVTHFSFSECPFVHVGDRHTEKSKDVTCPSCLERMKI